MRNESDSYRPLEGKVALITGGSRGLGAAVMNLLLDHPAVRRCRVVTLATRDAQRFYGRLGFAAAEGRYTEMVLRRNSAP